MKRFLAALLACLLLPACALAQYSIGVSVVEEGSSHLEVICPQYESDRQLTEDEQLAVNVQLGMMSMIVNLRMKTAEAAQAAKRAGADIAQQAKVYQNGEIASMALFWQGMQADGRDGSSVLTLTLDLETGLEITFDQLFADPDAAAAAMEAIIAEDVLASMNAYIEAAELLPMPRDSFAFDENGLTVYYPQERYRRFDGTCGYVTFYWHELAPFIGEGSPAYALSRPQAADAAAIRRAEGWLDGHGLLALHQPLGGAMQAYSLTDEPDYTSATILYPVDDPALRGVAVEIAKYAETAPQDTPICAVRRTRASYHGLTTGQSTRGEITALLGEPDDTRIYGEDAAYDALLEPGESLVYACEGGVLEAHLDARGVLSCLILRDAMPETLY